MIPPFLKELSIFSSGYRTIIQITILQYEFTCQNWKTEARDDHFARDYAQELLSVGKSHIRSTVARSHFWRHYAKESPGFRKSHIRSMKRAFNQYPRRMKHNTTFKLPTPKLQHYRSLTKTLATLTGQAIRVSRMAISHLRLYKTVNNLHRNFIEDANMSEYIRSNSGRRGSSRSDVLISLGTL